MTTIEKKLINDHILGKITKAEFLKRYPVELTTENILSTITKAYKDKNQEDFDYSLSLIAFDEKFKQTDKYVDILNKLLREKWHFKHEDIVSLLQGLKSPKSIDVLYDAAITKFDYLDYDDSYALARKCIHALGDINTEYSKEKLKLLADSTIPIIKEKALKQLYYYKRQQ